MATDILRKLSHLGYAEVRFSSSIYDHPSISFGGVIDVLTTLDKGNRVTLPIQDTETMQIGGLGRALAVMVRDNAGPGSDALRTLRVFEVFACRIPGENAANVRSEASTQSTSLGHFDTLYEGNRVGVVAQKRQSDGIWWQLAPGGWVRDDVSKKEGDCTAVPLVDE